MNYDKLGEDIVRLVGGTANVADLTHCVTRLRFSLKDEGLAQTDEIEKLEGVISVVSANRQYQVILGGEVVPTFNAIVAAHPAITGEDAAPVAPRKRGPLTPKAVWEGVIDYLSGTMVQVIPLFIGCGLISCILTVLNMFFGLDSESSTYAALNAMSKCVFYFLPGFVGYAAARKLKCNPMLGAAICLFLQHTSLTGLVGAEAETTLFGIPFVAIDYSSTVFPALFGVWVLSKIEPVVYGVMPKVLKSVFGPFLCLLIMCPLMLLIIGPAGYYFGQALANAVLSLSVLPFGLGTAVISALQPVLVLFGAHTVLAPPMIEAINTNGFDALIRPAFITASFGSFGAVLAVMLKTKNPAFKSIAAGTVVTSFLGTNEPAIYGVELPLVRPFITSLCGAFFGGMTASLLGAKAYAMGKNGVFGWLVYGDTLPAIFIASVVATAVAFALTWIIGFDESKVEK